MTDAAPLALHDAHGAAHRRSPVRAHLALAAAQVAFGLIPVFGQIAFQPGGLTPFSVGGWRLAAGALILMALAVAMHGRAARLAPRDALRLTLAAWMGVAINQFLYLSGLARSTPINAGLMMCLIPVFTIVLAAAAGVERFSLARATGVLVALGGTLLLLFDRGFTGLGEHATGNLMMAANAFLYSAYLIVVKPLLRRYEPTVLIAWAYVLSLPLVPFFVSGERLLPEPGHAAVWWSLAYIIAFPTVLAYLLITYALARVQASTTAIYIYVQPFITALASWVAFRERPTPAMLVAAGALFAGIWLVSRTGNRELRERAVISER